MAKDLIPTHITYIIKKRRRKKKRKVQILWCSLVTLVLRRWRQMDVLAPWPTSLYFPELWSSEGESMVAGT